MTDAWRDLGANWAASGGSNAWVLSGDRTETGKPILANDPHLGMGAPGVWYLARIDTPNGTLAGATARSEEHTSELQSLMRISYAVFCLKKKQKKKDNTNKLKTNKTPTKPT